MGWGCGVRVRARRSKTGTVAGRPTALKAAVEAAGAAAAAAAALAAASLPSSRVQR